MSDYNLYLLIDKHPVIVILMMTVLFFWSNDRATRYQYRRFKGDRSATVPGVFYNLCCVWAMVAVFNITANHWESVSRNPVNNTFFKGHRYDAVSEDTLLHSPLCGCKLSNGRQYHTADSPSDSAKNTNRISDLIRKSAP